MRLNISAGLIYPSPRPLDIWAEGRSEKFTKDFYGYVEPHAQHQPASQARWARRAPVVPLFSVFRSRGGIPPECHSSAHFIAVAFWMRGKSQKNFYVFLEIREGFKITQTIAANSEIKEQKRNAYFKPINCQINPIIILAKKIAKDCSI